MENFESSVNDNARQYAMPDSDMNQGRVLKQKIIPMGTIPRTPRSGSDFERIYEALVAYKHIHGDVKVPQKFKIPDRSPDFPMEMWGKNLGKTLHNIRYKHCHASYKPRLLELGVDYEVIRKKPRRANGKPFEDQFESERRKLVKTAHDYPPAMLFNPQQQQQMYMNHSAMPVNMKGEMSFSGLVDNYESDDSDMDDVHDGGLYPLAPMEALHQHQQQQLNHQMQMAAQMNLNNNMHAAYLAQPIPQAATKRKKSSSNGFDIIYRCLLIYKDINGHLMVPKRFIIPEASQYPQEAWGMKIGHSVCNIRNIGSYSEHRDKLEAIGFTFKSNLGRVNVPPIHHQQQQQMTQQQQQQQQQQQPQLDYSHVNVVSI